MKFQAWSRWMAVGVVGAMLTGCGIELYNNAGANRTLAPTDQYMRDAERYLEQGLDDSALAAFGLALETNPRLTEAHIGMGKIYLKYEDYKLASNAFERATQSSPNSFEAHYYLGVARQMMGKLDLAIQSYLRAVTINPNDFDANLNLASAYLVLNKPGDALPYARRATQLRDDSAAAWANLGAAYSLLGYDQHAVQAYRRVTELEDPAEQVLLALADSHLKLGNYDLAANVLESVVKRTPSTLAYERLGYAYFKTHRYEKALSNYDAALAIDPEHVAALNGRGVCLMTIYLQSRGSDPAQRNAAIESWRQSLKINPNQPRIVDLLSRYERLWTTRNIKEQR